jgi:hypothetical protein
VAASGNGGIAGLSPGGAGGRFGAAGSAGTGGAAASAFHIFPESLDQPCRGVDYEVTFSAGGVAGHTWEAFGLPEGLEFDDELHQVSGTPTAEGTLELRVVDANGVSAHQSYDVKPRDSCWLAYTSDQTIPRTLNLIDPVLGGNRIRLPRPEDRSADVEDFKFSPDGRFVAYRLGGGLRLAAAPTWQDQQIEAFDTLTGTVTQYAWSPDSTILAVALTTGSDTYLGGVDVTEAGRAAGAGGAAGASSAVDSAGGGIPGISQLAPQQAAVDSELVWYDSSFIAFHTTYDQDSAFRALYYAPFTGDGFGYAARAAGRYTELVQLRSAEQGLVLIELSPPETYFYAVGQESEPYFHQQDVVAPSAEYVGRAELGQLEVFPVIGVRDPGGWVSAPDCQRLLAWAEARERIACVTDTNPDHPIQIFDLDPSIPELAPSTLSGPYVYSDAQADGVRRAFSPSGTWLAFATHQALYVADLSGSTPRMHRSYAYLEPDQGVPVQLAFSADEQHLLEHRPSALFLHSLEWPTSSPARVSSDRPDLPLADPALCEEDFTQAPDLWCGNLRNRAQFIWAPDPDFAAFQTALGTLQILDIGGLHRDQDTTSYAVTGVADDCTGLCIGQFDFQP